MICYGLDFSRRAFCKRGNRRIRGILGKIFVGEGTRVLGIPP
jgi:hypothetical protein